MKFSDPEYGEWTKEQVSSDGYNTGCDGFVYINILWPEDGSASFKIAGMDGRTQKPISDTELWKVWTMLTHTLSESSELGNGRRGLCKVVINHIRDTMESMRGKE